MAGIHDKITHSNEGKTTLDDTRSSARVAGRVAQSSLRVYKPAISEVNPESETSVNSSTEHGNASGSKHNFTPKCSKTSAALMQSTTAVPIENSATSTTTTTSTAAVSGKFSLTEDRTIWRELRTHANLNSTSNTTNTPFDTAKARRDGIAAVAATLKRATYMVSCRFSVLEFAAQEAITTLRRNPNAGSAFDHIIWAYYIKTTPYNYSLYTTAVSEENVTRIASKYKAFNTAEYVKTHLDSMRIVKWYQLFNNTEHNNYTNSHAFALLGSPVVQIPLTPLPLSPQQRLPPRSTNLSPPLVTAAATAINTSRGASSSALPAQEATPLDTSLEHPKPPCSYTTQPLPIDTINFLTIQPIPLPILPLPLPLPILPLPPPPTTSASYTFTLLSEAKMCCVALRYRHSQHVLLPRYLARLFKTMGCAYTQFKNHLNYLSMLMMDKRDVQHSDNRPFAAAEDDLMRKMLNSHSNPTGCGTIGTLTPLPLCLIPAANGHTKLPSEQAFARLAAILKCNVERVTARFMQLRTLAVLHEVSSQEEQKASEVNEYRIGCGNTGSTSSNNGAIPSTTGVLPYSAEAFTVRQARRAVSAICASTDSSAQSAGAKRGRDDSSTDTSTVSRDTTQACADLASMFTQTLNTGK